MEFLSYGYSTNPGKENSRLSGLKLILPVTVEVRLVEGLVPCLHIVGVNFTTVPTEAITLMDKGRQVTVIREEREKERERALVSRGCAHNSVTEPM
jgi:hypothetical protein